MKKNISFILAFILLMFCVTGCSGKNEINDSLSTREFTDSLGRTVTLPEKIEKVALSGPLSQIYVFPLCPELLVGYSTAFSEESQKYIPEKYLNLPELGQLYGGKGTMNLEALLDAGPDVVIDVGAAKGNIAEDFDKLSEQTGIPFVHIDADIQNAPDAYRKLGELIGDNVKAEKLASWCENTLNTIESVMKKVDADNSRKSVVYCLGPKGLNVLADGSYHAQVLSMIACNAAKLDEPVATGDGNEIDFEQLLLWNPEIILFQHNSVYENISSDESWNKLDAVKNKEAYEIPCGPYGWISSPPAVQCYLGMLWLTNILYPEYVDYNLKSEVTEYYNLFYGYDLNDSDYKDFVE